MRIHDKIKRDLLNARKQKNYDESLILSTLLGEIERKPPSYVEEGGNKVYEDVDVVATIKSLMKSWTSALSSISSVEKIKQITFEMEYINTYLPQQLSEWALREMLHQLPHLLNVEKVTMGDWMKYLKDQYAGMYDGALASRIFKEQ